MTARVIFKIVVLSFIVLFFAEYLEPSAIGVRAGIVHNPVPSSSDNKGSKQFPETNSTIPHAMLWIVSVAGEKPLQEFPLLSAYQSFFRQQFQKEIYHPPTLAS
jgi:hypothetical protein